MTFRETLEKWKPEFGNIHHIQAVEALSKLEKERPRMRNHEEIKRAERNILFLINKKL